MMFTNVGSKLLHSINKRLIRIFHSNHPLRKVEDKKEMLASLPAKDEGTLGEKSVDIDAYIHKKKEYFGGSRITSEFNGIPFDKLPICSIKVSPNNTIISIADHKGVPRIIRSCGIEGFKNTRKGTNIAAQATAISISGKAIDLGWKTLRVQIRGIGPGRMSSIKGLQMGGLNIASITDITPVSWMPPRPRKQKKL